VTVVAIDGPAGAGKSTVAREVAERLHLARLDTGAMYRALTLLVLRSGVSPEEAPRLASEMELEIGEDRVLLSGEDVTLAIREPEVDAAVSAIAAIPAVRTELVRRQRAWVAERNGAVVEGRDIGSVVFPDADVKVYLTADPDERARRRREQVAAGVADRPSAGSTAEQLAARDAYDSSRAASPLVVPEGAIVLDSTHRSVEEVVEEVLRNL
jgi:cytidylate kinase